MFEALEAFSGVSWRYGAPFYASHSPFSVSGKDLAYDFAAIRQAGTAAFEPYAPIFTKLTFSRIQGKEQLIIFSSAQGIAVRVKSPEPAAFPRLSGDGQLCKVHHCSAGRGHEYVLQVRSHSVRYVHHGAHCPTLSKQDSKLHARPGHIMFLNEELLEFTIFFFRDGRAFRRDSSSVFERDFSRVFRRLLG